MNKELEALHNLYARASVYCPIDEIGFILDELHIIETALKRLEELEKAFVSLSKEDEKTKKLLSLEIEKTRTLEIIIAKDVNVYWFRYVHKCHKEVETRPFRSNALEAYNNGVKKERRLTQEEYNLLKEVLL